MRRYMLTALILAALMATLLPTASLADTLDITTLYKNKDVDASWSAADVTQIDLNSLNGDTYPISAKGDYLLSGSYHGQIVVEAAEDVKIRLILNGAEIVSPAGPAVYEKLADKLIVTLAEGTENVLTDGKPIVDGDDTIGAALYAEDDLTINGTGSLTVNGQYKHGIQSKSDLIIAGGQLNVTAKSDGIRGRNSVLVLDGELLVKAGGDGLVSTREDKEGKGWVVLAGGALNIITGDGAGTVRASANSMGGRGGWGRGMMMTDSTADNGVSQKAVKAATDLTVLGGSYTFDVADDGLHGVNVTVSGGNFTIKTGDDGMHADQEMTVTAGNIAITQCYEGLEGTNVTVTGGDIRIVASDDGINASGGTDASGFGGRWGWGDSFSGSSAMLTIAGGHVEVTAGGDGLDSNGSLAVTGGTVGVWAASLVHEGPIDFNGTGTISGGLLMIASTGGTMVDMASLSGAQMYSVPLAQSYEAGTEISVTTAAGETVSFAPQSAFSSLAIAGDSVEQGQSLYVTIAGNQVYGETITADMAGYGSSGNTGWGNQGWGGHGGGRRGW